MDNNHSTLKGITISDLKDNVTDMPGIQREHSALQGSTIKTFLESGRFARSLTLTIIAMIVILLFAVVLAITFRAIIEIKLSEYTIAMINEAINTLAISIFAFLFGGLGAIAKILMSEKNLYREAHIIAASGIIGVIAWLSVSSGVLLTLLAPEFNRSGNEKLLSPTNFQTLALVCLIVGMFASNFYLIVQNRINKIDDEAEKDDKKK